LNKENLMVRSLALAALVATGICTCPAARAADKVDFLIDWVPSGEEAYPYVGVQEGFFAQEGLDVTIRVGRGSVDVITKLATGTADFAMAAIGPLMAAAAQGPIPVKAVYSIYNKQPDANFTVKGSGITSIKDLAGRTIGTATFSSSNTIWPVFAAMNGLDGGEDQPAESRGQYACSLAGGGQDRCNHKLGNRLAGHRVGGQEGRQGACHIALVAIRT
jgi:NitT/TauT family transport system substrate-binding protein